MSLFLGKIHYWLFNKILWFNDLEDLILQLIKNENLDSLNIIEEMNLKFGKRIENKNLEEIIDLNNIHGWLQEQIFITEGRVAFLVHTLLENNPDNIKKLEELFSNQGIIDGEKLSYEINSPEKVYREINEFLLDGMPCDRVDQIISKDEIHISWKKSHCVHKNIWEKENVSMEIFYNLRDSWIESFVKTLNPQMKYERENNFYIIKLNQ